MKRKFFLRITKHRIPIIVVFIFVAVACGIMKPMVGVNYDMKDYLPEDSPSTRALDIMGNEYEGGVPNCRLMLEDITVPQAIEYKERIEKVDGVSAVMWLDDYINPYIPREMMDGELAEEYYRDGNALLQITVDKEKILSAVAEIESIAGNKGALTGDAVSTAVATESTVKEIKQITIMAILLVLIILVLATESWAEPFIILITIGVAVVINAGSNLIFGEISFVTNAAGSVLQLAVSLDYAVFMIHRYRSVSKDFDTPAEAMVEALCKGTSSILSSGLTTIIGFMALVLMRFLIGPDLGWALAKGVAISLVSVFVFMPAVYLQMSKLIEKTEHRRLMPDFAGMGKVVRNIMIPCMVVFVIVVVPAFMASGSNSYYYGSAEIFGSDTKLGQDTDRIEKAFGERDTYALMVPKGSPDKEKALSAAIQNFSGVSGVMSYVDTVGAEVPVSYLDEDKAALFNSEHYTRLVISADMGNEGAEAFGLVEDITEAADEYYPGEYHLAGIGVSNYDLMKTITEDMLKVNLIAIAAVYLIMMVMMRSFLLPLILVMSIEGAIWINTAIPFVTGTPIFYIAYLIISTVQLGATVDYAILFTDRYRDYRAGLDRKESISQTIRSTVPSILVSGTALTIVGTLIGTVSSHGVLQQLGVFIGRGAVCSMLVVFFVLPGFLYLFDRLFINRGRNKMKRAVPYIMALMMVFGLCAPQIACADSIPEKEEVVYGNMDSDGGVEKIYAVNIFEDKNVTDYGEYEKITNLTTSDEIGYSGNEVTVKASNTPFYYEEIMNDAELPWSVYIGYRMDGEACSAGELPGRSGALEIDIDISENRKCDSFFYENYALQVIVTLDGNYCRDILAEGATIANVGSDKQLTYTLLPGEGGEMKITADVTDFEMDEIKLNGVRLNMDIDVSDDEIMSGAEALEKGSEAIHEGAGEINSGAEALAGGAAQLEDGLKALDEGVSYSAFSALMKENGADPGQILQGNAAMKEQAEAFIAAYGDAMTPQQKALCEQLIKLLEGNSGMIKGMEQYLDGVDRSIDKLRTGAEELSSGTEQLAGGTDGLLEGTGEFNSRVSGIGEIISETIEEMTSVFRNDGRVKSFISDKNTNVKSVQFVLKTSGIRKAED